MAETIVFTVIGDVVRRVISLLTGCFTQKQSTEAKLRRISHFLIRIHSVVEQARGRQVTNNGILQWLSELVAGENHARYLLDEMINEHLLGWNQTLL
ncbi:unnamed protein product [Urochloa humidicola]